MDNPDHNPDHEHWMRRCLALARSARDLGHTAVGSLIVVDGVVVAEGAEGEQELPAPLAHAEMVALIKALAGAAPQLSRGILYTTVEPCVMCAYLIRQARIGKVVYGTVTQGAGGVHGPYSILSAPDIRRWGSPPEILGGILEEACRALLTPTGNGREDTGI